MEELMGGGHDVLRGARISKYYFMVKGFGETDQGDGRDRWRRGCTTSPWKTPVIDGYLRYNYGFRHDWGYYCAWFQGWVNS